MESLQTQGRLYPVLPPLDNDNLPDYNSLPNFTNTLKLWREIEREYQKYVEMQEQLDKTVKEVRVVDVTIKKNLDVALSPTNWKLIYEDISSDENRQHFLKVLNNWIKRDLVIAPKSSQPQRHTSTPIKQMMHEFTLGSTISKIYSYSSWERNVNDSHQFHESNGLRERNNSSDSGTNCDYEDKYPCSELSTADSLMNGGYKSDGPDSGASSFENNRVAEVEVHDEKEDSSLVKSMIMEKFEKKVAYLKNKRKGIHMSGGLEDIAKDHHYDTVSGHSIERDYDEAEFLNTALGETEGQGVCAEVKSAKDSIATYDVSDLISNYYGAKEQKPVKPTKVNVKSISQIDSVISYEEIKECLSYIENIKYQLEMIQQIKKALLVCYANKNLLGTSQHIEAEKLLLIATYKYDLLLTAVKNLTNDEQSSLYATMDIKDLKFNINQDFEEDHTYHYICLFNDGKQVKFTNVASPVRGTVQFLNEISLDTVAPTSKVTAELYSLKIKKKSADQASKCVKSMKVLNKLFSRKQTVKPVEIPSSCSFELVGKAELSKEPFSESEHYYLTGVANSCEVEKKFSATVKMSLNLKMEASGFLTVKKDEATSRWIRRWCKLSDHQITFWNNPTEEETEAKGHFNLKYSSGKQITSNFNLCSRPRTLVLEMQNATHEENSFYFLSADTHDEFLEWQQKLNTIVDALKCWNQIFDRKKQSL